RLRRPRLSFPTRRSSDLAGGRVPHPSYDQVSTGRTGHLESVQVVYDAQQISYARLVDAFWHDIDPTQADGQFCDHGPRVADLLRDRKSTRLNSSHDQISY